jgi:acyl-CoA dehydrogenase
MDFGYSPKTQELRAAVSAFMDEHVYPNEARYWAELEANTQAGKRWSPLPVIEELKPKARAAKLWNLFLPDSELGAGLGNQEYAPLADHGPCALGQRGVQLLRARHRQHGSAGALRQ